MKAREVVTNGLAFAFLGIPALFLLLAGAYGLLSTSRSFWHSLLMVPGSVLALVGVRREREPLYVLVLWSLIPGAILGGWLIGGKASVGLGAGVAALSVLALVTRYYDRKRQGKDATEES